MGWLKILLAALSVAPELIQTGKSLVSTVKGVAKGKVPDSPQLGAASPPPPAE